MEVTSTQTIGVGHDTQLTYRFPYPYLPNDGENFRLLQLYGDEEDHPIRSELFTCRRDDWKEQYFAMSYVWAGEEHGGNILIDDVDFPIRKNLYDFLLAFRRYMRSHGLPWAIVWTVALCIDQDTTGEKNHQVQIMSSIIHDAACVFSWLGCGKSRIETLLQRINHAIDGAPPDQPPIFDGLRFETAASELVSLEYWMRLWVVPEILLARKQIYMYGRVVRTDDIRVTMTRLEGFEDTRMAYVHAVKSASSSQASEVQLPMLFDRFGCLGCSLDHDRVFALLGVSNKINEDCHQDFKIDYGMSKVELLVRTMPKEDPSGFGSDSGSESDSRRALYIRNFVFMLGMTFDEISQADLDLFGQLCSDVYITMPVVPITSIVSDGLVCCQHGNGDIPIRSITVGVTAPKMALFHGKVSGVIPFEPGFMIRRYDMISLHPCNYRFPIEFGKLYCTGFVWRTESQCSMSRKQICGMLVQEGLLEWTFHRRIPSTMQTALEQLQLLGRRLSASTAEPYTMAVDGDWFRRDYHCQKFSGLQYLQLLAQFRTVVLLLQAYSEKVRNRP